MREEGHTAVSVAFGLSCARVGCPRKFGASHSDIAREGAIRDAEGCDDT